MSMLFLHDLLLLEPCESLNHFLGLLHVLFFQLSLLLSKHYNMSLFFLVLIDILIIDLLFLQNVFHSILQISIFLLLISFKSQILLTLSFLFRFVKFSHLLLKLLFFLDLFELSFSKLHLHFQFLFSQLFMNLSNFDLNLMILLMQFIFLVLNLMNVVKSGWKTFLLYCLIKFLSLLLLRQLFNLECLGH